MSMSPGGALAEKLADKVPAILLHLDNRLRIVFASGHCRNLLGYAPREMHGLALAEMLDAGTLRYVRTHVAALERGQAGARDYVLRHKDGSLRFCQVHAVMERDAGGRRLGYFACALDNAAARAAQVAMRKAQGRLGAALDGILDLLAAMTERVRGHRRARREFVARAEHELRTPLASIVASLELMREGQAAGTALPCAPLIGTALDNADRLTRLVGRLAEAERVELGVAPLRMDRVDSGKLVAAALAGVAAEARRRGVRVRPLARTRRAWIAADADWLKRIFDDLLRHVLDCTPPGREVRTNLRVAERTVIADIASAGEAEGTLQACFDCQKSVAPVAGGGLELCVAKMVVARLGGDLRYSCVSGRGAAVRLRLPCADAPSGASASLQ